MTHLHLQVFWGEQQQTFLSLDKLPKLSSRQQDELNHWCSERRRFLKPEIHTQRWVKVNSSGEATELIFRTDGTAFERNMFSLVKSEGRWYLEEGCLFVLLSNENKITEYRVIANALSNIHSGSEYVNGLPYDMMRFIQIKPDTSQTSCMF